MAKEGREDEIFPGLAKEWDDGEVRNVTHIVVKIV